MRRSRVSASSRLFYAYDIMLCIHPHAFEFQEGALWSLRLACCCSGRQSLHSNSTLGKHTRPSPTKTLAGSLTHPTYWRDFLSEESTPLRVYHLGCYRL